MAGEGGSAQAAARRRVCSYRIPEANRANRHGDNSHSGGRVAHAGDSAQTKKETGSTRLPVSELFRLVTDLQSGQHATGKGQNGEAKSEERNGCTAIRDTRAGPAVEADMGDCTLLWPETCEDEIFGPVPS